MKKEEHDIQLKNAHNEIEIFNSQIQSLKTENTDINAKLLTIQLKKDELDNQLQNAHKDIEIFHQQTKDLEFQKSDIQTKLQTILNEKEELNNQYKISVIENQEMIKKKEK